MESKIGELRTPGVVLFGAGAIDKIGSKWNVWAADGL